MQVERKTDELKPCLCGFKPDHVIIGYGSTPFSVWCPDCKKSTNFTKYEVTGCLDNIIDYWNIHVRATTLEDLKIEFKKSIKKRDKNCGYDGYKVYQWYWYSPNKQILDKRA